MPTPSPRPATDRAEPAGLPVITMVWFAVTVAFAMVTTTVALLGWRTYLVHQHPATVLLVVWGAAAGGVVASWFFAWPHHPELPGAGFAAGAAVTSAWMVLGEVGVLLGAHAPGGWVEDPFDAGLLRALCETVILTWGWGLLHSATWHLHDTDRAQG